jgi:hypothetical protein
MKQDDINLSKIYGSIKISDNKPLQLQENILQSARKWFDRMSNVPNQNVDDVVYSALKKAAQEIEKAGFDSSKILTADSIKTFKDLIQKNDKPELPKEVESTTGITPQEQPTETSSFNSQQESEDNLKFAPKPEITPSTQSAKPKPAAKPSYVPPPKIDLDAYAQKDETFIQQISRKAKENYEAKKRGEPIPFPEIYKKQKQTSETTSSTQSAKPKPAAKSKKTSKTSSTIEKVTPKKSKK